MRSMQESAKKEKHHEIGDQPARDQMKEEGNHKAAPKGTDARAKQNINSAHESWGGKKDSWIVNMAWRCGQTRRDVTRLA